MNVRSSSGNADVLACVGSASGSGIRGFGRSGPVAYARTNARGAKRDEERSASVAMTVERELVSATKLSASRNCARERVFSRIMGA